ncbi:hypothetical protein ACOSP7_011150 [Xanthoceras sorbifolium]
MAMGGCYCLLETRVCGCVCICILLWYAYVCIMDTCQNLRPGDAFIYATHAQLCEIWELLEAEVILLFCAYKTSSLIDGYRLCACLIFHSNLLWSYILWFCNFFCDITFAVHV